MTNDIIHDIGNRTETQMHTYPMAGGIVILLLSPMRMPGSGMYISMLVFKTANVTIKSEKRSV